MIQHKPKNKPCKFCGEIFLKVNPMVPFCSSRCANKYKEKKVREKIKLSPPKKIGSEELSESKVFQEIWESLYLRERVSFVTKKPLSDTENARAWYFSHVLPKGKAKYPMFKYYAKNIVLKEFSEHETWEYKQYLIKDDPQWKHVFELKERLLEEYEEHLKLFEQGLVEYYKI